MKPNFTKPQLITRARELRLHSTEAEKRLWYCLRDHQLSVKFRRQHPVDCYILDFACEQMKLGIELDGGQHNEAKGRVYDARRSEMLATSGWHILRFWNNDVMENTEGVLREIQQALTRRSAPTSP